MLANASGGWDWGVVIEYAAAFRNGAFVTMTMTTIIIICGTIIGVAAGVILASTTPKLLWVRIPLRMIVETLRALPVLVLLVWLHYVTPWVGGWFHDIMAYLVEALSEQGPEWVGHMLSGLGSRAFATATIGLSINLAAFCADIFRGELQAVPRGLCDAGLSLGMRSEQLLRRVLLPEATRSSLPAMVAMYITMFKFTTLAAFIGCAELLNAVFAAGQHSYQYLELYTMLAAVYLAILIPALLLGRFIENTVLKRRSS